MTTRRRVKIGFLVIALFALAAAFMRLKFGAAADWAKSTLTFTRTGVGKSWASGKMPDAAG